MAGINKKYHIKVEIVTPMNIGAGAENDYTRGADFIENKENLHFINLRKVYNAGVDMERYASLLEQSDYDGIIKILSGKLEDVTEKKINKGNLPIDKEIKSFIKNRATDSPIIPGSSLKGAIRSHIYKALDVKGKKESEVFGEIKDGMDFMRFIKVSDIEFDTCGLINTKIFNLYNNDGWHGGWKHGANNTDARFNQKGFNSIYEALLPGAKAAGYIMISKDGFQTDAKQKNAPRYREKESLLDIERLFSTINNDTREYLNKELDFFKKYNEAEKTQNIIEGIEKILEEIPEGGNSCMLKMAAGSGFNSITGDWRFDDYRDGVLNRKENKDNNDAKPKSRKIAIHNDMMQLMGFVKLTVISEAEAEKLKNIQRNKIEEIMSASQEKREQEIETRKREEEQRRIKNEYKEREYEAISIYNEKKYEEALALFSKLKEEYPEIFAQNGYIENCNKEIQKKEAEANREKIINEAKMRAEQAKMEKREQGLKILDEKYTEGPNAGQYKVKDFKTIENKVKQYKKEQKTDIISDESDIKILEFHLDRIYRTLKGKEKSKWEEFKHDVWKRLSEWAGEKTAREIYTNIINKENQ